MILTWVFDLLLVSSLLGIAAALLERVLRAFRGVTRFLWLGTMLASFILPLLVASVGAYTQKTYPAASGTAPIDSAAPTAQRGALWLNLNAPAVNADAHLRRERSIFWLWVASSLLATGFAVVSVHRLHRQRRSWRRATMSGAPVLIAPDEGPAVLGIFRPQIIVPEWLASAPLDIQHHVIAHECAHVAARDSALLAVSMIPILLAPWNPLLWWHGRRLRMAIEVDCDRRVLRLGIDMKRYAAVLMQVGLQRASLRGATASMSESPSTLEQRIAIMAQPLATRWTLKSIALAVLASGSVAAATSVSPPPLRLAAVQPTDLDRYVGRYEFASVTVLEIQRRHGALSAIFPDASADLLSPGEADEFRYKDADVTIHFERRADGQITGLKFEQSGAVTYAPRLSAAGVQAIQGGIAERYRKQVATPTSEQALRRLIEGIQSGLPDYAGMSAQLAGGTRTMLKDFQIAERTAGPIQSIEFTGVTRAGWDQYKITHAHGTENWQIALDNKGIIVGALLQEGS